MKLSQLRYFVAVARQKNFSRAASELGVSQPALTRQIQLLEEELDCILFMRRQKGIEITDTGAILLDRAEDQIRSFDQMREDMRERSATPSGRLRLGCPPALAGRLLAEPVRAFLKLYPRIQIEVREGISDQLARDVFNDQIDMAIASLIEAPRHLSAEVLFKEEIWIFASKGMELPTRISAKFLSTAPLLMPRPRNPIREMLDAYALRSGVSLSPVVETDSTSLNRAMLETSSGYAIAPKFTLWDLVKTKKLTGRPIPGLLIARCLIKRNDRVDKGPQKELAALIRRSASMLG
jgi:LysR family nitrogen assimilation transcriptional regulator